MTATKTPGVNHGIVSALRAYVGFILLFAGAVPLLLWLWVGIGPTQQDDWFPWDEPGFDFQATYEACVNMRHGASP